MTILAPVIMSGGAGTRLWPVSREGHPKPFMKLADGESLIEKTYRRAAKLPEVIQADGKSKLITVTNRDYYFMSRDELHKAGATGSFLLEPCGRNTAPAIAMAAYHVQDKFGPDALMLVLSADHLIRDEAAFAEAVQKAVQLASSDRNFLVTFGILPTAPETGFGYIEAGSKLKGGYKVKAFVEKPDAATAQQYIDSGDYFWNSGMFCFSAGQFLKQLSLYAPEVEDACKKCWSAVKENISAEETMIEISEELFERVPNISVDYAVMERSNQVAVVPSDIGWTDVGTWNEIRNLANPDEQGNRVVGDAILIDSKNTFVQSEERMVAAVGVSDLLIVDTRDALLVANPANTQDIKQVVSILRKNGHDAFRLHRTVMRPWGTYTILEEGPGFKMKRIEVKPGGRLSLQSHRQRSEHWVIVQGEARVIVGDGEFIVKQNESTYIPAGQMHRLENMGEEPLVVIEVQCGSYLGEDDIVRFDDCYGRAKWRC